MNVRIPALSAFIVITAFTFAKEQPVTSKVAGAKVFLSGAQVIPFGIKRSSKGGGLG